MNGTTNRVNGHEEPTPLPSAKPFDVSDDVTIQPPLSRRGHGPALILLVPQGIDAGGSDKTLDPPPLQKWAEEGFAVAQISLAFDANAFQKQLETAFAELTKLPDCDSADKIGLICRPTRCALLPCMLIDSTAYNAHASREVSQVIESITEIVAVVTYGDNELESSKPLLRHGSEEPPKKTIHAGSNMTTSTFPGTGSFFTIPAHDDFRSAPAAVAHTRCLTFLKPHIGGPYFDLEAIWDEHTKFEFGERAVEKTMGTMVQEPYVNHIPTMTGGIGRERLTNFYRHHFIFNNPDDTALKLVSRTVGIDRVIDEFIFRFTHDRMIDWL